MSSSSSGSEQSSSGPPDNKRAKIEMLVEEVDATYGRPNSETPPAYGGQPYEYNRAVDKIFKDNSKNAAEKILHVTSKAYKLELLKDKLEAPEILKGLLAKFNKQDFNALSAPDLLKLIKNLSDEELILVKDCMKSCDSPLGTSLEAGQSTSNNAGASNS